MGLYYLKLKVSAKLFLKNYPSALAGYRDKAEEHNKITLLFVQISGNKKIILNYL